MVTRVEGSTTYTQAFNVENRLNKVTLSGSSTETRFSYDVSGQRIRTDVAPIGSPAPNDTHTTTVYPFPGHEVEQVRTWQYLCSGKGGTNVAGSGD